MLIFLLHLNNFPLQNSEETKNVYCKVDRNSVVNSRFLWGWQKVCKRKSQLVCLLYTVINSEIFSIPSY